MWQDRQRGVDDVVIPESCFSVWQNSYVRVYVRFENLFMRACDKTAAQIHVSKRGTTVAIERRVLIAQHRQTMCIYVSTSTAILSGPVGPAECLVKTICHGVSALSLELRWTLSIRKRLVTQCSEIEVMRLGRRMVNLAFERIKPVCKFFDITEKC